MRYKICPYCGAHLDPDERCDCREEVVASQEDSRTGPAVQDHTDND